MKKIIKKTKELLKSYGFYWLFLLIGIDPLKRRKLAIRKSEIDKNPLFDSVDEKDKIDLGIEFLNQLSQDEHNRLTKVENKAFTLLSINGVAAGLITGVVGFILDKGLDISMTIIAIVYLFSIIPFILTMILSMKVMTVGIYSILDEDDVHLLDKIEIIDFKKRTARDLLKSIKINTTTTDKKVSYLIGAQTWFKYSVYVVFIVSLIITFAIGMSSNNNNVVLTQTATSTPLASPSPSSTFMPTNTMAPTSSVIKSPIPTVSTNTMVPTSSAIKSPIPTTPSP